MVIIPQRRGCGGGPPNALGRAGTVDIQTLWESAEAGRPATRDRATAGSNTERRAGKPRFHLPSKLHLLLLRRAPDVTDREHAAHGALRALWLPPWASLCLVDRDARPELNTRSFNDGAFAVASSARGRCLPPPPFSGHHQGGDGSSCPQRQASKNSIPRSYRARQRASRLNGNRLRPQARLSYAACETHQPSRSCVCSGVCCRSSGGTGPKTAKSARAD